MNLNSLKEFNVIINNIISYFITHQGLKSLNVSNIRISDLFYKRLKYTY